MMHVLVTGSNGQLGSELQDRSFDTSAQFFFTTRGQLDITDTEAVEAFIVKEQITTLINCAAYTAVDTAEIQQEAALQINLEAVKKLGALCKKYYIRLIHISTDYVFDGTSNQPYTETSPCKPVNFYGRSKQLGEQALQELSLPNSIIIRTSWVYSVYGANFVKTMLRLGAEKQHLNVVADQIGSPTYAGDLADFIVNNVLDFKSDATQVYHYRNEGVCSWYDFAQEIMRLNDSICVVDPIPVTQFPTSAARPYYSVLDTSRLKQDFQVRIPYWRASLALCISKLQNAA
ncbi:dTDP-4-dehydrorhamnose reductase [Leeuwenhoekiella marinoflava]|uniref:dTDP-4-dehydrorhamnose reductase n=2 Tax=Leeuwenhoekiella marinoflava TaxID=988 RepID=A0A4Q0PGA2_9FLAO|nr:dTDP-4-dehydrorhamnose reductase [Leeuwenhoekiella marinoflava]RXG25987.1 dTDP-4-dehydrorhamnose reductase [Leeuwenhoekiella marinoflava]SHF75086.1 dTDP-4-dehydrorhamnose reductase [Leeuwenhoekiella marinoflava DSM 3653]